MSDSQEMGQLAKAELLRLQRQVRVMENEFAALMEEKRSRTKNQNKLIEILQKEHSKMKSEICFLEQGPHAKEEYQFENRLEEVMEQHDDMIKILEQKKINQLELDAHVKKIERELDALRKNEVTDSNYKDTIANVKKDVVKLENRLDVANKRCSAVLVENAKLRKIVDHMLQDRASFNDMWQTMVNEFNQGKKYIMDLIEQSAVAFDQREELCNKLQALKEKTESDKMIHTQEMRELQRKLEHDAKLQRFYDVKGQKRINTELDAREANKKLMQKEELEKQLAEYNQIITHIKRLAEQDDVNQLAKHFTTQEEENFALFNYVNELSHEVEVLNDMVQKLSSDIEDQEMDTMEDGEKEESETVEYYEKQKKILLEKAKEVANEKDVFDKILKELLDGIDSIFQMIKCNEAPILGVLNTQSYLTVHNVRLFLGVIDKRINVTISNMNADESANTILAKKDRIPKFNVKDFVKMK